MNKTGNLQMRTGTNFDCQGRPPGPAWKVAWARKYLLVQHQRRVLPAGATHLG